MSLLGKVVEGLSRFSGSKRLVRSKNYRKNYLKKHKGFFGIYTCSYCGALIPKGMMEVDHIFPVHKAKEELIGMSYVLLASTLSLHGKEGVNGTWNTCSSCHYCNHLKAAKGGLWVLRGYFGRIVFPIINLVLAYTVIRGAVEILFHDNASRLITGIAVLLAYRFICWFLFKREEIE